MTTIDDIRRDCWDKALHCLGTSYIFMLKTKSFKRRIRFLSVLGLAVPICVGAVALAYGTKSVALEWAIAIAGPILIFQVVMSVISLGYRWEDGLAYSLESQTDNRIISDEYQALAKNPLTIISEMQAKFEVIKTKDQARTTQDEKVTFTRKEERRGMRYALWIMKRQCATCNIVPSSMSPSQCETCGKF